jgi:4-diphosphocytidyl-2-C-methyl-D-erythritol kinase
MPSVEWKSQIENGFEKSVFPLFPEIEKIKTKLYDLGAEYASMSGSGSSIFGLFKFDPQKLYLEFPGSFCWHEKLLW